MSKLTIVETGPARNSSIYNNLEEAGFECVGSESV